MHPVITIKEVFEVAIAQFGVIHQGLCPCTCMVRDVLWGPGL